MAPDSTNPRDDSSEPGMQRSSIHMPQALLDELDRIAAERMTSRSQIIREAVVTWIARQKAGVAA